MNFSAIDSYGDTLDYCNAVVRVVVNDNTFFRMIQRIPWENKAMHTVKSNIDCAGRSNWTFVKVET